MSSEKQWLFRNYLIKRIGFVDDGFLRNYLYSLARTAKKYRYLGASPDAYEDVENEKGEVTHQLKPLFKHNGFEYKKGFYIPKNYGIIDLLNEECKIKHERKIKNKASISDFISATDISNFTYCPVNFSISKTFDLIKLESAHIGTDLHEEKNLAKVLLKGRVHDFNIKDYIESKFSFINSANKYFFDEVFSSSIIYSGHSTEEKKKYFKSLKGKFVGQPDYIFKNANHSYFVVEEKFQFEVLDENSDMSDRSEYFYSNHINQLLSYLHGISEYDIKYGYLIYWKFSLDWNKPVVHSCYIHKVVKSDENRQQLLAVYISLKNFVDSKVMKFDIDKRSAEKCANCVSNLLCGHKTGRFNTVSFPYSINYVRTYYAEFPKELKKDYNPDGNSDDNS